MLRFEGGEQGRSMSPVSSAAGRSARRSRTLDAGNRTAAQASVRGDAKHLAQESTRGGSGDRAAMPNAWRRKPRRGSSKRPRRCQSLGAGKHARRCRTLGAGNRPLERRPCRGRKRLQGAVQETGRRSGDRVAGEGAMKAVMLNAGA